MTIKLDSLQTLLALSGAKPSKIEQNMTLKEIKMNGMRKGATKQIHLKDIENFLNEPSPSKAANHIFQNSPVGLGKEPTKEDFENMGYKFTNTAYHIGAPVIYESTDGGKITIYNGKGTPEMGEDKRKIVYEKGNLIQEMYYDENGNLQKGKIRVKDDIIGNTERSVDLIVQDGKRTYFD